MPHRADKAEDAEWAAACLSEDMQDGRRLSGVEFINPFATDAAARLEPLLEP